MRVDNLRGWRNASCTRAKTSSNGRGRSAWALASEQRQAAYPWPRVPSPCNRCRSPGPRPPMLRSHAVRAALHGIERGSAHAAPADVNVPVRPCCESSVSGSQPARATGPFGAPIRRLARARWRTAPMHSCFRTTPKAGARTASRPAGARSARTRSPAACASTACATPEQVRRSCRAKVCRSSVHFSVTTGIAEWRAAPTLPMRTLSKRWRRSEQSSPSR